MSFKGLNDSFKQRALPYFLDSANHLKGLHLSIAISKQIKSLVHSDRLLKLLLEMNMLTNKWNTHTFNKLAILTHFIALLIAGVSQSKQNIYWYSDEDMLFANTITSADVSKVLGMSSTYYVKTTLGELGIGTTKLNEQDFWEEDLNAIPDLVGGCLSEFFDKTYCILDKNMIQGFAYLFPQGLSRKTQIITEWLANSSNTLKKLTIVFDRINENGGFKIWKFDTMPSPI